MKKGKGLLWILVLVAAGILLGSRAGTQKKETTPEIALSAAEEDQTFQIPEGAAYIAFPKDPDHDDFLAFDREFAAALAARKSVICTSGHMPLGWSDLCVMDYGIFWLKSYGYSLEWAIPEGETEKTNFYTYHLTYFDLSESEIQRMKQEMDAEVGRIFSLFPADADDWTKALIVHDELVKTAVYDHEQDSEYYFTAYGPLVRHEAICQGYAAAFSFVLSRAGINTTFSASEDHGWNWMGMPCSHEEYIDCTWDDHDLVDAYGEPYVAHDFFFLTREEVESVDSHTITSGDPYNTFEGELVYNNYFRHEGYMLDRFDTRAMAEVYRRQLAAGKNLLEVRFETEEEYRKALSLLDDDCAGMNSLLGGIGYYNGYWYFQNDDIHTISIGLNPAEQ